jgi:peroxiredoxin
MHARGLSVKEVIMNQNGMMRVFFANAVTVALVVAGCGAEKAQEPKAPPKAEKATSQPAAEKAPTTGPQLIAPANEPKQEENVTPAEDEGPQNRTAFYRADAAPAVMPKVVLSKGHQALCKVKVGDVMPAIELPQIGGAAKPIAELYGKAATVLVFWKSDRRMSREELADLGPDVVDLFGESGVAVVGVAVNEKDAAAQAVIKKAGANFVNILDADGKAFAQVGSERLPRTFVLDPQGKILWFDIEYSAATRRELHQALRAVTGVGAEPAAEKSAAKAPAKQ